MHSNIHAMYLRKSREDIEAEARGAEDTLKRHRMELVELAIKLNVSVAEDDIYFEVVTADTVADRPEMLRLLAAVGSGKYRGVLCMDVDRLARGDTSDQGLVSQTFLARGTLIVTPYRTYDPENESDRDFFEMKLFFARMEYRSIVRRMQTGRGTSTKEGKYAGSVAPYGFDRVPLPHGKGFTLRVREDQAKIVQLMRAWYFDQPDGQQTSLGEIARRLNAMGIPSPRGKAWRSDTVSRILFSPLYYGYVTWGKRKQVKLPNRTTKHHRRVENDKAIMAKGLHAALAPIDDYAAALQLRAKNRPLSVRTDCDTSSAFSGLIICGECGLHMRIAPGWGLSKAGGVKCKTPGCPTSGAPLDMIERTVLSTLRGWIADAPAKSNLVRLPDPAIAACAAQVSTLELQLARIYDSYERGIYDDETFLLRKSALNVRLEEARAELKRLRDKDQSPADPSMIDPERVRRVLSIYPECRTASEKNQLLRSVIEKIIYHKTHRCVKGENAVDFLSLDIFPRF